LPLARTKSGTLTLTEDDQGLRVRAMLDPDDPDVQLIAPKMRRGDLTEMSFGFRVPAGGDKWSDDRSRRTIVRADIDHGDVSIVTYAANPATTAELVARARQRFGGSPRRPVSGLAAKRQRERLAILRVKGL
jgi:HK97 family phage prohead protease